MNCADLGPDLVALALGQLPAAEAAPVEAHVASCAPCRAELEANRRLLAAARDVAGAGPSASAEERLLAAFRAERDAAPGGGDVAPPPAPRRATRVLSFVLPLAAAAAVLVAVVVTSRDRPAFVVDGEGILHADLDGASGARGVVVRGEFAFAEGAAIEAGRTPFTVRLSLAAARPAVPAGDREPGRVDLNVLPAARIRRTGANQIDLLGGAVEVSAGPLAEPFTVRAANGDLTAVVRGTRFVATTADGRLVVVVREGKVELGRRGGPSEMLGAGEQGLVDAERLLRRPADARATGDTLLTPRARLRSEVAPEPHPGQPPSAGLHAWLEVGDGGPVSILPFDDSEPRFLLRLKGDDGRVREVKLQRSMLLATPPGAGTRVWRLEPGRSYDLSIDRSALGLAPGRYEASLRYMSYRGAEGGAEWLGVAESDPVPIEVPAK